MKPLPFADGYFVNEFGDLFSTIVLGSIPGRRGPIRKLKPKTMRSGHKIATFWVGGKQLKILVHRIVATMFHGQPSDPSLVCRHLDGDPSNNHVSNLAWGTVLDNNADMARHGSQKGDRNPGAKLTEADVLDIRRRRAAGEPVKAVATRYSINKSAVGAITARRRWAHVKEK